MRRSTNLILWGLKNFLSHCYQLSLIIQQHPPFSYCSVALSTLIAVNRFLTQLYDAEEEAAATVRGSHIYYGFFTLSMLLFFNKLAEITKTIGAYIL